jgi:hypothetical protein
MLGLLAAQRVADGAFLLRAPQGVSDHPDDRRVLPPLPLTTGAAAALLGTTEPRLSEIVRRGHVTPPPPILAGRRLWSREHLLQAAAALDILNDELRTALGTEVARG